MSVVLVDDEKAVRPGDDYVHVLELAEHGRALPAPRVS